MQKTALAAIIGLWLFASCHSHDGEHSHDSSHNHETAHEHSHDTERPALSYTTWTPKTELFVEFPALVVGSDSRFAAHFSYMSNFKPVTEGKVEVTLSKQPVSSRVDTVSAPGIFRPTITPTLAGTYSLTFIIQTPTVSDTIVIQDVEVYESINDAIAHIPEEPENPNEISFLKEQAWKMPFANAPVVSGSVYDVIKTGGSLVTTTGNRKALPATTSGVLIYTQPNLVVGSPVVKNQHLFTISGGNLSSGNIETDFLQAKANFEKAESKYLRNKTLFDKGALSAAEFELVTNEYELAKTTYDNLAANYSGGGKKITAPMSGYIEALPEANGTFIDLGEPLAIISQNEELILTARVTPGDFSKLNGSVTANFTLNGKTYSLADVNGRLLSYGKNSSESEPGVLVQFSIQNVQGWLPGSYAEVWIKTNPTHNALLIPTNSLLEEYGNYYAIVQTSGEGFEKRLIELGNSDGKMVEVISGLAEGERVVTTGAYQVKMAGMSGQAPAHGHAH